VVESTTSILRREPWIEVFEEHIRLPDGRLVDDFYTIKLRDFVVVAPYTLDGRLVLVRHYRHGPGRMTHSLPSGFIEGDETPAEAARRELLEETGYESDAWSELGSWVVDGNRRCGVEHVFLATGARRITEPSSHDLAESTVELMTTDEAVDRMWRGDVSELASAAGLALALLRKSTSGA
jgi:ADP-ribose pyrophosphatase